MSHRKISGPVNVYVVEMKIDLSWPIFSGSPSSIQSDWHVTIEYYVETIWLLTMTCINDPPTNFYVFSIPSTDSLLTFINLSNATI